MRKNVASQNIAAQLNSLTTGAPVTSGTTTVYVTGDGGTQATGSGTVTHEGNGAWNYAPTQAETNFDHIAFTFANTAAISQTLNVYTTFPQTGDNFARLGAPAGASISADIATRMATYTQPTGFLAATFPGGTVANTTNITAGTITTTTNLTNLPSIPANWLTAAGIAAGALNGKGDWNIGKTGYTLTQTFPANFSALSITAGGLTDITQVAADKAWSTGTRVLTAGTNIVLAKGTGVTGFTDLSATQVENAVWDATMASHVAAGSTGQRLNAAGAAGDPWATALPGAYGAGTAGNIVGNNLDATVSSRLSTAGYTAPLSAAGTRTAVGLASANLDTQLAALPTATANADALLNRDMTAVSDTNARTPLNALRFLRNKWSLAAGVLTVTKENDTTTAWTAAVSTDAAAVPVIGSDPT